VTVCECAHRQPTVQDITVVNISSISALQPYEAFGVYAAGKVGGGWVMGDDCSLFIGVSCTCLWVGSVSLTRGKGHTHTNTNTHTHTQKKLK